MSIYKKSMIRGVAGATILSMLAACTLPGENMSNEKRDQRDGRSDRDG